MDYKELRRFLEKANQDNRVTTGFIDFDDCGPDGPEELVGETFLVRSDNAGFNPAVEDSSIFGENMYEHGEKKRLDIHMEDEKGGPNTLKIGNCGIVKFHLICDTDFNISSIGVFATQEEAVAAMRCAMAKALRCKEADLDRIIEEGKVSARIGEDSAWVESAWPYGLEACWMIRYMLLYDI